MDSSPIYISELQQCEPRSAITERNAHGWWRAVFYDLGEISGTLLATGTETEAAQRVLVGLLLLITVSPSFAEDVPLTIEDRSSTGQANAFVCSGIPFGRGKLKNPDVFLADARGREVPSFVRPMIRWSDGSIKWLQIQTQISLRKNETRKLALKSAKAASSVESTWKESQSGGSFVIANGILSVEFVTKGTEFIRSLDVSGKTAFKSDGRPQMVFSVDHAGPGKTDEENWLRDASDEAELEPAHGVIENFHIDEKTPFRFIVRYEGGIVTEGGERKCSFVMRYFLFRGSARMKVEWTLIWDCNPDMNFMRMCGLRFPAELSGAAVQISKNGPSPIIGTTDEVNIVATKPDVRVHQIPRNQVRPVEVTSWHDSDDKRTMIGAGTEASGSLYVKAQDFSVAIAGERFTQRYPKEISVNGLEIIYYLWPASTKQLLDFRNYRIAHVKSPNEGKRWEHKGLLGRAPGTATTERIWLDFSANVDGETLKAQAEKRLLLKTTPEHYINTGVFGPVIAYSPKLFPVYEGANEAMLYWIIRSPDEYKWYGLINDGGSLMEFNWARARGWPAVQNSWMCRGYSGWAMDDGGTSWAVLLSWLRSGNDDFFDAAERFMNCAIDVSCIHSETEASIQMNNAGRPSIGGSRRHNAQAWGDYVSSRGANPYGKFFYYLLTGEPRYLDVIAEGLYFEWIYWSYENWTMVGSLSLGYELFTGLKQFDPFFDEKHRERVQRFTLMHERAKKNGWKKCASAAGSYLAVENQGLANPPALLDRAKQLLHSKVNPRRLDFVADGVVTEGVKYYELAQDPSSAGAKYARDFNRIAADEVVAGRSADGYAPLFQGRGIGIAHAMNPNPKYEKWVQARLDQLFIPERLPLVSLNEGLRDISPAKLGYLELWRRISLHEAITPQKIGHIYGMVIGRMPYFLRVLNKETRIKKAKTIKTQLEVSVTPALKAVWVSWAGPIGWEVAGYEIHRRQKKNGELKLVKAFEDRDATEYLDRNVVPGKEYHYVVKIRDRDGKTHPIGPEYSATPPSFVQRINCGGESVTGMDGADWEKDRSRSSGTGIWTSGQPVKKAGSLQAIYQTERWASRSMQYAFDVKPGRYQIVLHFAETNRNFAAEGKRVFSIYLNDEKIAGPIDVFARVGFNTAFRFSKMLVIKASKITLVLRRTRGAGSAIKGIEVLGLSAE